MSALLTSDIVVPVISPEMGLMQKQTQRAPLNVSFCFPQGSEYPLRNHNDPIRFSESSLALSAGCLANPASCLVSLSLRAWAGIYGHTLLNIPHSNQGWYDSWGSGQILHHGGIRAPVVGSELLAAIQSATVNH